MNVFIVYISCAWPTQSIFHCLSNMLFLKSSNRNWHSSLIELRTALFYSQPQPVQGLPSTLGWQTLSLLVWKYGGTDQQPQTCGLSCTTLTGWMGHLQWDTQQTHVGPCQVWRQWLSMQWPSLPSLTAHCVQSSPSTSPSAQLRVSVCLSVHCIKIRTYVIMSEVRQPKYLVLKNSCTHLLYSNSG